MSISPPWPRLHGAGLDVLGYTGSGGQVPSTGFDLLAAISAYTGMHTGQLMVITAARRLAA